MDDFILKYGGMKKTGMSYIPYCECRVCGEKIYGDFDEIGGFFDKRLIHFKRKHPDKNAGAGWSILQRLLVW